MSRRYPSRASTYSRRSIRKQGDRLTELSDPLRSHRGGGGESSNKNVKVLLTRRTSGRRTEEAELSVPNSRSIPILEKVFEQITAKFNHRSLIDISPENRRNRDASFVAEVLSGMLHDLKYGSVRENSYSDDYEGSVDGVGDYHQPPHGTPYDQYEYSDIISYSYSDDEGSVEYQIEWIEHKIEVPKIEVVEKLVEVPQKEEVIKYKTIKEIQEVEVPVYKEVVKPEIKEVIREVQVPGKIIETPKEVIIEKTVTEDVIHDYQIPVSIVQCLQPIMQLMKSNSIKTTAYVYEPKLQEVDVFVPIPVEVPMDGPYRMPAEHKKIVEGEISCPQYNSICIALNKNLLESRAFDSMKKLEEAVKRVNPDMDCDLLVVRHNDDKKQFTDRLPMLKKDDKHPDKIPLNADASVAAPKASVILDLCDPEVAKLMSKTSVLPSFK
eukprot:GHVH01012117.1.p1 GENE.GHVH01012117.1~~GHVH01012117.1.p1  ORF type:complete len:457 (+),score=86.93 GHVH01012117.1:59-1372(+)